MLDIAVVVFSPLHDACEHVVRSSEGDQAHFTVCAGSGFASTFTVSEATARDVCIPAGTTHVVSRSSVVAWAIQKLIRDGVLLLLQIGRAHV